jgi:chemotaxis protein methyltransferase CheR
MTSPNNDTSSKNQDALQSNSTSAFGTTQYSPLSGQLLQPKPYIPTAPSQLANQSSNAVTSPKEFRPQLTVPTPKPTTPVLPHPNQDIQHSISPLASKPLITPPPTLAHKILEQKSTQSLVQNETNKANPVSVLGRQPLSSPNSPTNVQHQSTGNLSVAVSHPNVSTTTPVMRPELFTAYREHIYKLTGIFFTETKKYLLEGRIHKRMVARNISSYEGYLELLKSPNLPKDELLFLYEAITINETYFFRSEQQFDSMTSILIPEILKKKQLNPTLKIWSSASSTGEEAYTIAMILHEKFKPTLPNLNIQIVGTDISQGVINSARRGVYREYAIRNVPKNLLTKHFTKRGDEYHLSDEIKKMVRFEYLNLYDTQGMNLMQSFDIIFCCNVLIYFDQTSKQQVVSSLFNALNPQGYLFIGYSESLHGISKAFNLIHLPKALVYQKP